MPREHGEEFDKAFVGALDALFQETGLSQSEVARRAGISQVYVSQMLAGERGVPSHEVLFRLARAFDKPLSYFSEILQRVADVIQWYSKRERVRANLRHRPDAQGKVIA